MADQRCPNCGRDLPSELGQHSLAPMSGLAQCPYCGAEVRLAKESREASGGGEAGLERGKPSSADFEAPGSAEDSTGAETHGAESLSGHETVTGVMKEIEEKDPDARRERS
jgi:DNA-directed RNA polymerase subunit RPC12/RpoP